MERYQRTDDISYSLGMSLTIEAIQNRPEQMKEVLLSSKASRNHQLSFLLESCENKGIPYRYDDRSIEKLSQKENCYCIGFFRKFKDVLLTDRHIVLYGFSDLGELGTVLRSAVSFDFKDIVLAGSSADHFDPRCIRASMGSVFHCRIISFADLDDYSRCYPYQNLYPFTSDEGIELKDMVLEDPYSILIPQEYEGLDDRFPLTYHIAHKENGPVSLSIRSSIILAEAFHQNRSR